MSPIDTINRVINMVSLVILCSFTSLKRTDKSARWTFWTTLSFT